MIGLGLGVPMNTSIGLASAAAVPDPSAVSTNKDGGQGVRSSWETVARELGPGATGGVRHSRHFSR